MEVLANLALGFGVAFSLQNLLYCLGGVALGTLIGVLPGISPLVAIGMLFPLTFTLPPIPSLIMLAGIYYGAQYSQGPKASAHSPSGGPRSAIKSVPTQPAKNEASAATASAGPARPWRAIW